MKRLWKRKWLVVAATMAIFLSVGAVAWAAVGDDPEVAVTGTALDADEAACLLLAATGEDGSSLEAAGTGMRKAVGERRQEWRKLQAALMEELREDMTAADQALYDQLVTTAKGQRGAVQEAREALADTVKQLRDLRDKYLDTSSGTSGSTG